MEEISNQVDSRVSCIEWSRQRIGRASIDRKLVDVQSLWRDGHVVTEGWFQWSDIWNRRTGMDLGESLKISD